MSEFADMFEKGFFTVGLITVATGLLIVWAIDIWTQWRKNR